VRSKSASWEHREQWLRRYSESRTPSELLFFKNREGWFVLARTGFLAVIVSGAASLNHVLAHTLAGILALYLIVDALLVNTAYVFITGSPVSPLRSAVLTIGTYFNLAQGFAVAWLWQDNQVSSSWPQRALMATYESLRTMATIGPEKGPRRWDGKLLVIIELLVGIYFVAIVIAIYASWAQKRRPTQ
jgi:hypothetical protein